MTLALSGSLRNIGRGWLVATAMLALAGCPSDPVPTDAFVARDTGTTSDAPPSGDAPAAERTIAAIAAGDARFSTLVAAATRVGLVDTLNGPGTFTIFAPTNDAFTDSGLTTAAIAALTDEQLRAVLAYHGLVTEVPSSAIAAGPVTTIAGFTAFIGTTGGVTINGGNAVMGGANVVTADVEASNGVIHIIDRVLLPPTIPQLAVYGGLSTLAGAVSSAGLADDLSAPGPFTVFAPTNAAFAELPAVPTGAALEQVLLYHVVNSSVLSTGIPARANSLATNRFGNNLTLLFNTSSGVTINGAATVQVADLRATNGVVHVVSDVILPMNVVQAATAAGLTGLTGAVTAAAPIPGSGGGAATPVAAALAADAPYTVFAPTNAAFTAAMPVTSTLSPAQLRDVLLFHVLNPTTFTSPVLSTALPGTATPLDTINGADIAFNPTGPTFQTQSVVPSLLDIHVTNGVIHVINGVMIPAT